MAYPWKSTPRASLNFKEVIQKAIVTLSRRLRDRGVHVTPADTIDATRAVLNINIFDFEEFYFSLRSTLVKEKRHYETFRDTFAEIFLQSPGGIEQTIVKNEANSNLGRAEWGNQADEVTSKESESDSVDTSVVLLHDMDTMLEADPDSPAFSVYSTQGATRMLPYDSEMHEIRQMKRIVRKLTRIIATKSGMRWAKSNDCGRIDLKRTIKQMTSKDKLVFMSKKQSRTKLLVLTDISGSMKDHGPFLIKIMYALQSTIPICDQFIFGNELVYATPSIRGRNYDETKDLISTMVANINEGTKIGACLSHLIKAYPHLLSSKTMTLIISDGWDTGDIALLKESLATIKRITAGVIIWLNPLLDSIGYEPSCAGMLAAIPYTNVFASTNVFRSTAKFNNSPLLQGYTHTHL